ncbi:MAG: hypothetical protein SAJ37_22715 [Oscillatoria sp. PMC 1068.18]|nr:hypothetical protein [Oscillatoria sp. PMC 1076.18]MEC4991557.1 hypothetical protein [Oscillatoria sp. PMC 1068.18]
MKVISAQLIATLLGVTALAIASPAKAQTETSTEIVPSDVTVTQIEDLEILSNAEPTTSTPIAVESFQVADSATVTESANSEVVTIERATTGEPIPGTVATSVEAFRQTSVPSPVSQTAPATNNTPIAQTSIEPGRLSQRNLSYVGVGFNIGFGDDDDTGIGDGGFAINGKIALSNNLSVRPAVIIGDDADFIIPITYDFTIRGEDPFEPIIFKPYVGGGVAFSTGDDENVGFVLSGGVEYQLTREFVANANLNVGFIEDSTQVGLLLGVGYIFPGF